MVTFRRCDSDSRKLAITFTPAIERKERPSAVGFGEAFLNKNGFDAICFVSKRSHWWQVPEIRSALSAARTIRNMYCSAGSYGVSMGGYGALLFSKDLNVDRVVAINPQFSIDPGKAPYESRWAHFARRIEFINDDIRHGINPAAQSLLIYDPFSPDAQHIRDIGGINAQHFKTSFSGHATSRYLTRLGLLGSSVIDFLNGEFELKQSIDRMRASRTDDTEWLISAAEIAIQSQRSKWAEIYLGRVREVDMEAKHHVRVGTAFRRTRDLTAAAAHYEMAHRCEPENENYQRLAHGMLERCAEICERRGLRADALSFSRRAKDVLGIARQFSTFADRGHQTALI